MKKLLLKRIECIVIALSLLISGAAGFFEQVIAASSL